VRRHLDQRGGWRSVDGGIVESMKLKGVKEYVHWPSLVAHRGVRSTKSHVRKISAAEDDRLPKHNWPADRQGVDFDALDLLKPGALAALTPPAPRRLPAAANIPVKGVGMSERLRQVLAFFRPLPECMVTSNDADSVSVDWQGGGGCCRYFDTPEGVRMEWLAEGAHAPGGQDQAGT
jgi:hypothetical protein